jgi:hypothetical protein
MERFSFSDRRNDGCTRPHVFERLDIGPAALACSTTAGKSEFVDLATAAAAAHHDGAQNCEGGQPNE